MIAMRWGWVIGLMSAMALPACFVSPHYEGRFCSAQQTCPNGYACANDGRCHAVGDAGPAGIDPNAPSGGDGGTSGCFVDQDCTSPGPCETGTGASCLGGQCIYPPMLCNAPPPGECLAQDTVFRTYSGIGTCSPATGACDYPSMDVPCANCTATCVDPCANVQCTDTHGGCRSQGFCTQTSSTEPATCAYTDVRDGTRCEVPSTHAPGTCKAGDCFECMIDADCASPASCQIGQGARCQGNRCVYPSLACRTPPPAECVMNDSVLRTYSAIGSCDATLNGACQYPSMDIACPSCTATCLNPCQSLSCNDNAGGCRSQGFCRPGMPGEPASCAYTNAADETSCALATGGHGVCSSGACVQCIVDHDCDDGDPCTIDACASDVCNHTPQPSACPRCDGPHANLAYEADGRTAIFARGPDNAVYRSTEVTVGSGAFSSFGRLAGSILDGISVASNVDGRLEAFVRSPDGALWHAWEQAPNGTWTGWASLAGSINLPPHVGVNQDGRLEVFARGANNAIYHIWQKTPGGAWSTWTSLGGSLISNVAVAANPDGRLEVFGLGTDSAMWHIWQKTPGGAWQSGWASLGGSFAGSPVVVPTPAGLLEVFARGSDGAIHFNRDNSSGVWSGWTSLGGGAYTCELDVAANTDGRLEVFVRGNDNAVHHNAEQSTGGAWSGWTALSGAIIDGPAAHRGSDGRIIVVGLGVNAAVDVDLQSAPNASTYGAWAPLPGLMSSF